MQQDHDTGKEIDSIQKAKDDAEYEIDLLQMLRIIIKRKYILIGTLIVCLIVGAAIASSKKSSYIYTTKIEVGSIDRKPLESFNVLEAKLNEFFIPQTLTERATNSEAVLSVRAIASPKSSYISLVSESTTEAGSIAADLHSQVFRSVYDEHRRVIDETRDEYKKKLVNKQIIEIAKLTKFTETNKLLVARGKRYLKTRELLGRNVAKLESELSMAYSSRSELQSTNKSIEQQLALQIVNELISRNLSKLAEMHERLKIKLEDEQQQLSLQLSENKRKMIHQQQIVKSLQSEVAVAVLPQNDGKSGTGYINKRFQDTRVLLGVAVRSVMPPKAGKSAMILMAAVFGIIGGIIIVFGVECLSSTRCRPVASTDMVET